MKLILDAVFCSQGGEFRNEIVWCYRGAGYPKKDFGRRHDLIFRYSKGKEFTFNLDSVREEYAETTKERFRHHIGNKRGKKDFGQQSLNPLGKQPDDWWEIQPIAPSARERLGYPTQKPESLLEKIIKASSNENDVILDAYCGCGTTVAVCQKLDRQWIGIDITYQSISLILKRLEDSFSKEFVDTIKLHGIPKDIESARALANKADDRTRKEFEKWAILTYTNNRAIINAKKGADKGVDGTVLFYGDKGESEKVIFQVKSGKVKSGDIRDLLGTMTLENASIAIFITLENPTKDMLKTAKSVGFYQNKLMTHSCDKIQIVTVQDIIENKQKFTMTLSFEVLKSAEKYKEVKVNQIEMDLDI